jgi:hypothetical protein
MTSVLDLKDPKNRKIKNNHSFSGALNENFSSESDLNEFLKGIDNDKEIQDNSEIMEQAQTSFPATFTSASGPFSWTSPDRHQELISHNLRKWIIVILVGMTFLALLWQGSILTAITFFALALVTSMHFWRETGHNKYEIHPHGILAGDNFYHYRDLDSFWIHYHPEGYHELSLCTGKLVNHYIKIPFHGQDLFQVRDALAMYLPEERHEEGLEDWLRRKLGL